MIKDGNGSAVTVFTGGGDGVASLVPLGADVSVLACGIFS